MNREIGTPSMPMEIATTQKWFAEVITTPLDENHTIHPHRPNGNSIVEESAQYVSPSPTLLPHQRMQIYNQQYWWRLINILYANFPLVTRILGSHAFSEKIAIPYLLKYPPNHWSLNVLGDQLMGWLLEHYQEPNRTLILNATELDQACMAASIAVQLKTPDLNQMIQKDPELLLSQVFYLQQHIHLFKWKCDLPTFRAQCLEKDKDGWVDKKLPHLAKDKTYFFILYRNFSNDLAWKSISQGEYLFLQKLQSGSSMQDACAYMESQGSKMYEYVAAHLQKWIQEWVQAGWLTLSKS